MALTRLQLSKRHEKRTLLTKVFSCSSYWWSFALWHLWFIREFRICLRNILTQKNQMLVCFLSFLTKIKF